MKYIVVLGDGMADYPVKELGNQTPLDCANKPNMDRLCKEGVLGLVSHVPDSLSPGSDVANLSAMGYDPVAYYTGRSPLEAVSMGIDILESDVVFRCNLVTLSEGGEYRGKTILDHSADEITTAEARALIAEVEKSFGTQTMKFYPGVSYRHALVWQNGPEKPQLTPPHDILEKPITDYLPKGEGSDVLSNMMEQSYALLKNHPINQKRRERGLRPANSIWIWGEGKKPRLDSFYEKFGLRGAVISAVDLIKGIAICAGMKAIDVPGATGNIHTDFDAKAQACLDALSDGYDFVYIHIEAPDECGHRHEIDNKVRAISLIDEKVVGKITRELDQKGEDYRMLILPDHPTPLSLRTHTKDPVPYILYDSRKKGDSGFSCYCEKNAKLANVYEKAGYNLLKAFLEK